MRRGSKCCIPQCVGNGKSFHELPSNMELRKKWLDTLFSVFGQAIKLPERALICNLHFEPGSFKNTNSGRTKLNPYALPTVFEFASFNDNNLAACLTPESTDMNLLQADIPDVLFTDSLKTSTSLVPCNIVSNEKGVQVEVISKNEIDKYKTEIKLLNMKIKTLNQQIDRKNKKLQMLQEKVDNLDLETIEKIRKDASENNPFAVVLMDQLINYNRKNPKWSEMTIRLCIMWRISSPRGYEFGRKNVIKLPSRSTLHRYLGTSKKDEDISNLISKRLTVEASFLSPIEKICSLVIDDMSIKEKLHYSKSEDKYYGLDNIHADKVMGQNPVLANKMLCFVIHGLSTKYTIPVAYFFHRTMNSGDFYNLTINVLREVHRCGFIILRTVTDNHKSNVALFKLLGEGQLLTYIPHPIEPRIPLFLSFDYCHGIKNGRSIYLDHDMCSEEGIISSKYLKQLYEIQKNLIIKPVRYLTKKHIYPSNFEKMNVKRAVEIFSPQVTAAIKYLATYKTSRYDFSNSEATVTFMEMMYKFFQVHDVSDKTQYIKQLNPNCAPYININDERLIWMLEVFPAYINSIQEYSKRHKMQGLTKETAEALIFTAKSTAKCIQYLLGESGFYYVLTRTFSSDSIESMFSHVRMGGGFQDATDARAAHYAIKRILQCGLVKTATSANVFSDCSYTSSTGNRIQYAETDFGDGSIHGLTNVALSEDILESLNNLQHLDYGNLPYGIPSAAIAFLAGYIVRTINERIDCQICLDTISTISSISPLLALINFQDRGSLKYPSRNFIYLINQIARIVCEIVTCLPVTSNPFEVLSSILSGPLITSDFFVCKEHCKDMVNIILSKLVRPILANIGKTKSDKIFFYQSSLQSKPSSRKVLKL